jgi:hypothetical protein
MLRVFAAVVLLGLLGGCGDDAGRFPVRVEVVADGSRLVGDAQLEGAIEAALARGSMFAPRRVGEGLRAGAALVHDPDAALWQVRVEVEVPPDLVHAFVVPVIGAVATAGVGPQRPEPEAIASAASEAVRGLEAQCRLARGDLQALSQLLGSGEPEQVLVALRFIRDRETREHADRVVPLLEHRDPRVGRTALEVLGAVGGQEHAAAIVRRVHMLDPRATREAYRALAQLGGPDAVGFLRFAADNEDDAELRAEAERALSSALSGRPRTAEAGPRGVDLPKIARGHRQ